MLRLKDPVEVLLHLYMLRWELAAPKDKHEGLLDDAPMRNSQISRFGYVVKKIAIGKAEPSFRLLEQNARRTDGRSYIFKGSSWMREPYHPLGWVVL